MSITRKRLAQIEQPQYGGVFGWLVGSGALEEGVIIRGGVAVIKKDWWDTLSPGRGRPVNLMGSGYIPVNGRR